MENAQLALLFLCGYLLSRLLVKTRVPEYLVVRLLHREASVSRVILYLVALAAFLSVLIPNAVTAVTLIPVVLLIRQKLIDRDLGEPSQITTALALAIISGANIGGMASITATPANGVLVAYAALRRIPDHGLLRFDGWLLWGVPLTLALVAVAWGCLLLCLQRVRWLQRVGAIDGLSPENHPRLGLAAQLAFGFFVTSFLLSAAMHATSEKLWVLGLTAILATAFVWRLFGIRPEPLLTFEDCFKGLPWRGLAVVAAIIALAAVAAAFGLVEAAAKVATLLLPAQLASVRTFAWVALLSSMTTQFASNTVVQLALFETLSVHPGAGESLIYLLLVVTLSSTCAFMTPIATGVNGLVYGELSGVSLGRMLFTGAVMSVASAVVIAAWVFYVVAP